MALLGSRHWERDGWELGQGKVGYGSYCYGNNVVSLQINTAGIMAMNRVDRIVLDPIRTYACTRTARTGVRVTPLLLELTRDVRLVAFKIIQKVFKYGSDVLYRSDVMYNIYL